MANILEIIEFRIIGAIIILLVGLLIGLIVQKVLSRILHEVELDKIVKKLRNKNYFLEKKISRLAAYLIYFATFMLFLRQLGVVSVTLYIIFGIVLLLLGATFLVGIKDFIPNFISGIVLSRKENWKEGKEIRANGIEGKIKKLGLLEVEIETKKGESIYVPNSLLTKIKVLVK